jgi:hypothetical protein
MAWKMFPVPPNVHHPAYQSFALYKILHVENKLPKRFTSLKPVV